MSGSDGHSNAERSDTPIAPLWRHGRDGWRRLRRWLVRWRYRLRDRAALIERLRDAHDDGLLDVDALTMLEGVLHVSDMQVRDIIVPRAQMDVIARDAGLDQIIDDVVESAHSRFPVIGDSRDDVVGILLAKDVLRFVGANAPEAFDIQEILRPAVFVPESKRLNVLLKEFRLNRNHMAIVVDEYGGVAGLVTIEDVLEQIVGEIADEHDVEDYLTHIMRHPSGRFTIKALTPLEEFNAFFNVDYDLDEFDTVGGLVLNRFGHMPKRGDQIAFDDFVVRVLRADARRIHLLELRLRPRASDATDATASTEPSGDEPLLDDSSGVDADNPATGASRDADSALRTGGLPPAEWATRDSGASSGDARHGDRSDDPRERPSAPESGDRQRAQTRSGDTQPIGPVPADSGAVPGRRG